MPKQKISRSKSKKPKAWVVAVNMGYGHQRPAHSLHHIAETGQIVVANSYPGIPAADKQIWHESRRFYEFISRFKNVPLIGDQAFKLFDKIQSIPQFYPKRDLSKPTLQVQQIYNLIKHRKWGEHLIKKLNRKKIPLVTTFFAIAFMAEEHGYDGEIYCITTDTDISRAWAPLKPRDSNINYLAPNFRVVERLQQYGVDPDRIFLTGFPLPQANIGGEKMTTLRGDIAHRLVNLDPNNNYCGRYHSLIEQHLKIKKLPKKSNHPLTLTFAVGGAGAQREIGGTIIKSLAKAIKTKKIKLVMVAGIHNSVSAYFRNQASRYGCRGQIGKGIEIIHAPSKEEYFDKFNEAMRTTDILWTKPSELSFYTALGIPIVIAPPIGSQEIFNRKWLRTLGVAANQYQPEFAHQWIFDWVESGWFAEAAMQGFIEAPKFGTYNIEKIIASKPDQTKKVRMALQY